MEMPCTPTPRRAAFIMPNMPFMPAEDDFVLASPDLSGLGPSRQATASSKFSTQVAEPLMPIFFSMPPVVDAIALSHLAVFATR